MPSRTELEVPLILEVLVDPTRREVVEMLGAGPRRAGELAEGAGTSPSAMSRHLRVLLEAGFVEDERSPADARIRMFKLRPESMVPLQDWLDRIHDQWQANLEAFKNHIERGEQGG